MELPLTSESRPLAPTSLRLEVANHFVSIEQVNQAFNAFAAAHAVPDDTRRPFNIAFDDLINNIVSYGYQDDAEHLIEVEIELSDVMVEARISDDGVPFDPFAVEAPDLDDELDERRIGGLGIHLVRTMMDEALYRREFGKNIVVIRKLRKDSKAERARANPGPGDT